MQPQARRRREHTINLPNETAPGGPYSPRVVGRAADDLDSHVACSVAVARGSRSERKVACPTIPPPTPWPSSAAGTARAVAHLGGVGRTGMVLHTNRDQSHGQWWCDLFASMLQLSGLVARLTSRRRPNLQILQAVVEARQSPCAGMNFRGRVQFDYRGYRVHALYTFAGQ